jgi:hypothetical protein
MSERPDSAMLLRRPGVQVALFSLLTPLAAAVVSAIDAGWTPDQKRLAVLVVPLVLLPFILAIYRVVPRRYWSNPKLGRLDWTLGPLSLLNFVLVLGPTLLIGIGLSNNPPLLITAGVVCAIAAGALTEYSRRRWPDAWINAELSEKQPIPSDRHMVIRVRPRLSTRLIVFVRMGGLGLLFMWFAVQGFASAPAAGVVVIAVGLSCGGMVFYIFRIEAGCNDDEAWCGWKRVSRTKLGSYSWRPSLTGTGPLRLLDSNGILAVSIPAPLFSDEDLRCLIGALQLKPQGDV